MSMTMTGISYIMFSLFSESFDSMEEDDIPEPGNNNNSVKMDGQSDSSLSVEPSSVQEQSFSQVESMK